MKRFAFVLLSAWAGLTSVFTVHSQSITSLVSFGNTNGAILFAGLTLGPDGNFYGATYQGGSAGKGTVFRVTTNGTLTTLVNFSGGTNQAFPVACLTLAPDGNFYSTSAYGGSTNFGTAFKITANGTLTMLASFNMTTGGDPYGSLILGPDGNFYGTAEGSGPNGNGTVFKMTTDGTLTTLASFNNADGANPKSALTLGPDGNFYGTTVNGGTGYGTNASTAYGTVFKVTTNGTLTTLVNFGTTNGANPVGPLTLGLDGNFYGTTYFGGSTNDGTVFKVTTNGAMTTLVNFKNTNGANPYAGLTLAPDGNFYGTTYTGGSNNYGTVFKMTANGTLTTLASFNNTNGASPWAGLTLGPDGNLYGTTEYGGGQNYGTIFRLNLPPGFIRAPSNQTAIIGSTAALNCELFGTGPFAYQWLFKGAIIAGATNAFLTFSPVLTNAIGNYQLVVKNAYGSITSQVASLSVLMQPNVYSVSNSSAGNFTVYLAGKPNTTNRLWMSTNVALNQWQVIATNITDGNGLGQFMDTNTAGMPQKFYRLSYP